jgi:hypothetical protein
MRKSKLSKNNELKRMSKYDNTNGDKNINKDISVELIVVITRTRRILPSS